MPRRFRRWPGNASFRWMKRAAFRPATPKNCSRCSRCSVGQAPRWPNLASRCRPHISPPHRTHRADAAHPAPFGRRAGTVSWRWTRARRAARSTRWRNPESRPARRTGCRWASPASQPGAPAVIIDAAAPPRGLGQPRRPCQHPGVRADFGPPSADRELRVRRQFRRGMAPGRAGDSVAFHAVPRRVFQRSSGRWRRPQRRALDRGADPRA